MPLILAIAISALVACVMVAALVLLGYLVQRLLEGIAEVREYVHLKHKLAAIAPITLIIVGIVAVCAFDLILAFGQMSIWATVMI